MTLVHLVRHGTHERVGAVLCGRMPGVSLSEAGRTEAQALARRFAGRPVAAVHASPLERTSETARPIAQACGVPLLRTEKLVEIDFGAWTGKAFETLNADPTFSRWNAHRDTAAPPGGETMLAVQARLQRWLDDLATEGGEIVAVSHQDVIKAALCLALGLSVRAHDRFAVDPASVSTLSIGPFGLSVLSINGSVHDRPDEG